MALSTSQYVRRHYVTVVRASWGTAFAHAHNLNDGNTGVPIGYTPNLASIDKAYVVDANGIYHAIPNGVARIPSVTATNVNVWVGENAAGAPALVAALAAKLGGLPVSIVLEVSTRFVHSKEIGTTALGDEAIGLPAAASIGLPIDLLDYATPTPAVETVYVRTTGADTNDGRTSGTAWLTLQKAFDYLVSISPLRHFVLVDVGAGTFAGNVNWDGIDCSMGYTFHVVGNQPIATPAVGSFRRLVIAAGVGVISQPHDDAHWRFTPNGADSWVNPAGAGLKLEEAMIGQVVHIHDATHSAYAVVGNVDVTPVGLGAYIDITPDVVLMVAPPAWVTAVGTTWDLIGWADPSWTVCSGIVAGRNVHASSGAATMASGAIADRYNCFAYVQFTSATGATFESCERLAFPGCRFANAAVLWSGTLNGSMAVNTVPQAGDGLFFWPAAIWTRMGFTDLTTDDAWGGLGFAIEHNVIFGAFAGSIAGLVWTRSGGSFSPQARSNVTLSWCSFGPDAPAVSTLDVSGGSHCTMSHMKMESQIRVRMPDAVCRLNDYVSWLSRVLVGANAPVAATPTTHVTLPGGMMYASLGGTMVLNMSVGSFYEGINSDADPTNYVVQIDQLARYIDLESAHKGTFFGCKGWLAAREAFAWFSRGALSTWHLPGKPNVLGAAPDIFLDHHAIVKVHPNVGITKDAVDTVPGTGIYADHDSQFLHGDPANHVADFIWGAAGGAGLSVGAGAVFDILNGSVVEVGNLKSNVAAGQLVMRVHFRSHILYGSDGGSYVLANNGAATEKIIGGNAAQAGHGLGALILLNDDIGVALPNRECCTERSV